MQKTMTTLALTAALLAFACQPAEQAPAGDSDEAAPAVSAGEALLSKYTTVRLTADTSQLSDAEKQMIPLLIEAADAMDRAFWKQAYGDKDALMASLDSD